MLSAQPRRLPGTFIAPIARVLTTLGIALLALAAVLTLLKWLETHSLLRATAVVSENVVTQDAAGVVSCTSRLRFRLPSGETVLIDDPHRSDDANDPDYVTGANVPVAYPAEHPEQARIATTWRLYHAPWVAALWGTALFDLGLILRLILKRYRA